MAAVYRVRDQRTGRQLALKRGYARDPRKAAKRKRCSSASTTRSRSSRTRASSRSTTTASTSTARTTRWSCSTAPTSTSAASCRGSEACALLRDVASSLAILHSRGLLHRDVSARNVRCTADGRAKLIDFGAMTSMGVAKDVVGTPPFVAPEVAADAGARRARRSVLARRARLLPADRPPRVSGARASPSCATCGARAPIAPARVAPETAASARASWCCSCCARPQRAAAERGRGDRAPVRDRRAAARGAASRSRAPT